MTTLLFFAFLSGMVTIAAPCIWPILPIVLSAGATGGRRRPLGIVAGLVLSFTVVTLALSSLVRVLPIDPESLRLLAVVVIGILGISLLVPAIGARLEAAVSRLSGRFGGVSQEGEGFKGGFLAGLALGVVWSPCAGPILAAVATLAATRAVTFEAVLVTLAFGIGIAIPLFLFALFGQKLFSANRFLRAYTGRIQQVFGGIMILAALAIWGGYDKTLQSKILDVFPEYGNFLLRFEDRPEVERSLEQLREKNMKNDEVSDGLKPKGDESALPDLGTAPEFRGISTWLNTDGKPISMADLRGQVVLVDFWTYSCINCIRTLPYVTGWYEKYKDDGFVVVGVHTPEFAFEHKTENVQDAMNRYGIGYPVAQDNDYGTWKAYKNRYWPAHYLIDAQGRVRYTHFGEGEYDTTEKNIQALLAEAGMLEMNGESRITNQEEEKVQIRNRTPETYLGLARMDRFASPETAVPVAWEYTVPGVIPLHSFAYGGRWNIDAERAVSGEVGSSITLRFEGNKVFLVLAPPDGLTGTVAVFLDGRAVSADVSGGDLKKGSVFIDSDRLYELIDLHGADGEHTLRLEFGMPGTSAYAFTFG
jgi:cytochrome c biogenesis protein CcdA/thiol-disulfide isomerase/thioredoxin